MRPVRTNMQVYIHTCKYIYIHASTAKVVFEGILQFCFSALSCFLNWKNRPKRHGKRVSWTTLDFESGELKRNLLINCGTYHVNVTIMYQLWHLSCKCHNNVWIVALITLTQLRSNSDSTTNLYSIKQHMYKHTDIHTDKHT